MFGPIGMPEMIVIAVIALILAVYLIVEGIFSHHRRIQDAPALRLDVDFDQWHRGGCSRRDGV